MRTKTMEDFDKKWGVVVDGEVLPNIIKNDQT